MTTLLDLEFTVLENLDDSVDCEKPSCNSEAKWACKCRNCARVHFVCDPHLRELRAQVLISIAVACSKCEFHFHSFDEGIEVTPL